MHALVIALFFIGFKPKPQPEALEPNGISVVYNTGSTATQAPRQAPIPTPAETPPPPAPPAAQTAQNQPEVNLNMPETPLATMPQLTPQPMPQTPPAPRQPPRPPQRYTVMNNMNYGNSSSPAPTIPHAQQGMDLSLPQTDAQAVTAPDFSIKGNVGSDWQAGFNKWVYAHLYYPDSAAEQGQQGYVTVTFTAHRDGSVTGLHMTSSSGSPFLDQAWEGIFAHNQLPPFPPGGDNTVDITATVHYEIVPP